MVEGRTAHGVGKVVTVSYPVAKGDIVRLPCSLGLTQFYKILYNMQLMLCHIGD